MIVEVLTLVIHNTLEIGVYVFFYLTEQHSKFLLHILQVLYMCTLCDSTNINTIIEFVPNCLQHVSGDGFNGGSDSYLQFRDTCGKRRNINLILDVTPQKEITWGFICRTRWELLKPRQSFRITLCVCVCIYIYIYININNIRISIVQLALKDICVCSLRMVTIVLKHVGLIIYYMIMIFCLYFVGLITENKLYIVSQKFNGKFQTGKGMYI